MRQSPTPNAIYGKLKMSTTAATLTPQRKHRKMLKDGSSEVWPEHVEAIFVQGLEEYLVSPYANHSRGRSRWRNQFLVDHLKRHNIERSKKQVASHIQVLRNMWKGEYNYRLVAGGEDAESDEQPSPPTFAGGSSSRLPGSPTSPTSSSGRSELGSEDYPPRLHPGGSAANFYEQHRSVPVRPTVKTESSPPWNLLQPDPLASAPSAYSALPPLSGLASASYQPDPYQAPAGSSSLDAALGMSTATYGATMPSSSSPPIPVKSEPEAVNPSLLWNNSPSPRTLSFPPAGSPGTNRLSCLSLWAPGVGPCNIDVDQLAAARLSKRDHSGSIPRMAVRMRLRVPSAHHTMMSAVEGFQGAVTLAAMWQNSAYCHTYVSVNGTYTHRDIGALEAVPAPTATNSLAVMAPLPQSALSRCRWLEEAGQVLITQRLEVDDEVVALLTYELERVYAPCNEASIALIHHQSFTASGSTSRMSTPPVSPSYPLPTGTPLTQYARRPSSQLCAFTSVNVSSTGTTRFGYGVDTAPMPYCQ